MPEAEFSEDEFEHHLISELQTHWGRSLPHFKPSRLLENSLGYDFALFTTHPRLTASGVFLNDPRLDALNAVQRKALIPQRFVSTFVQTKRPFYAKRRSKLSAEHWTHWSGSHFRVTLDDKQIEKLEATEKELGDAAVVRVASPCFWRFDEIEAYYAKAELVQRTHYQRPSRLEGHSVYSYQRPLEEGFGTSDPERIDPSGFLAAIPTQRHRMETAFDHVVDLYMTLRRTEPFREALEFTSRDKRRAQLSLGPLSELPLFPMGRLEREEGLEEEALTVSIPPRWTSEEILEEGLRRPLTLGLYARLIFALHRFASEEIGAFWRMFYSPSYKRF